MRAVALGSGIFYSPFLSKAVSILVFFQPSFSLERGMGHIPWAVGATHIPTLPLEPLPLGE